MTTKKKKIILLVVVCLVVAGGGFWLWSSQKNQKKKKKDEDEPPDKSPANPGTVANPDAKQLTPEAKMIKDYWKVIDENGGKVETPPFNPTTVKELATVWHTGAPGVSDWLYTPLTIQDYQFAQKITIRKSGIKPQKGIDKSGAYYISNIPNGKSYGILAGSFNLKPIVPKTIELKPIEPVEPKTWELKPIPKPPEVAIYTRTKTQHGNSSWLGNLFDYSEDSFREADAILIDKAKAGQQGKRVMRSFRFMDTYPATIEVGNEHI